MTRVQLTDPEWEFIGPYSPIGKYGPYPGRLRQQFEGVIWRFKTGGQWRDADVFESLLEGLIAEAAKQDEADLSLVSIDSTTHAPTPSISLSMGPHRGRRSCRRRALPCAPESSP